MPLLLTHSDRHSASDQPDSDPQHNQPIGPESRRPETDLPHIQTVNINGGSGGAGGLGHTGGSGGTGEGPAVTFLNSPHQMTMINMDFAQQSRSLKMGAGERKEIMDSLAPINFFQHHGSISHTRQRGTGQWLLDDPQFQEWQSSTGRTLWLRGIPGAGKTVLASMVVDYFSEQFKQQDTHVACIYLNHKDTEKQTPANLLTGLWRQLVLGKNIGSLAKTLYELHHEKQTSLSAREAFRILCQAIKQFSKVYIVIDGMDEYPEKHRDSLQHHLSELAPTVSLMITSRPSLAPDHRLPKCDILDIQASEKDIRMYVDAQIKKSGHLFRLVKSSANLAEEIQSKIVDTVDGMFLLAKLHMDELATRRTVKGVRESLKTLPKTLDLSYDNVMRRIEEQRNEDKDIAHLTLTWVTKAKRPLTIVELQTVLAIEPNTKSLDQENILPMDLILDVCAGLVIIDKTLSLVQIVHYTTQEYLDRIWAQRLTEAHTKIARTLFTYLAFDEFSADVKQTDVNPEHSNIIAGPLFRYGQYCLAHAAEADETLLSDMILEFLAWSTLHTKAVREKWKFPPWDCLAWPTKPGALWISVAANLVETANLLLKCPGSLSTQLSDSPEIIVAAYYGHLRIVQLLVEHGAEVNVQGGEYHTALQAAASSGQFHVTEWLLKHSADINVQGGRDGTAIQAASYWGYKDIVQLLIEYGADVKAQGGYYGGALQRASASGHLEIVKFLLDHGFNVNTQDERYGSALYAASSTMYISRHTDIVRVLLDHQADVNAKGGPYGSPLQAASANGHRDIVQLLIDYNADINMDAGLYGSALHVAFGKGHFDILDLLVINDAKIQAEPYSILHAALSEGNLDVFSFLVKNGADVNVQVEGYGTCLRTACIHGKFNIAKLLIEHNANVNTDNEPYGSLLHETFARGHIQIFKLLLEHGADANVQDKDYGTCLRTVCRSGNLELAKLLLKHGAQVDVDNIQHGSLLHEVFLRCHLDIFRLLVEHGADVNVQDPEYGTCLNTVSTCGNLGMAQLLIEHGADVNADTGHGSLLHAMLQRRHFDIFKLLVRRGADVNVQHEDQGTCLHLASLYGNTNIVRFLLKHRADANARGGQYGNALHAATIHGYISIVSLLYEHGAHKIPSSELFGEPSDRGDKDILADNDNDVPAEPAKQAELDVPAEPDVFIEPDAGPDAPAEPNVPTEPDVSSEHDVPAEFDLPAEPEVEAVIFNSESLFKSQGHQQQLDLPWLWLRPWISVFSWQMQAVRGD
ncbi:Ankyrin 2,3/unc44 [Mycena sanguinolenta]|uniref:Ankyrin 2,3/unc44 n=1 Tax=Mycena sanguinolenta TaxID=230812 RepID=A0A8H6Y255_9AGAR|nr:Ankyrin 2,3/unc44 [Mycena sanguinolenta]